MFRRKVERLDGQTEEQHAWDVKHARRYDAYRRAFNDMMRFWRVCEKPLCGRQRTCSDDMHACFQRHWAIVPEEHKEYVRGCIEAVKHTRSRDAIHRGGLARQEQYRKTKERIDAMAAARAAPPVATAKPEAEVAPRPGPRIRGL